MAALLLPAAAAQAASRAVSRRRWPLLVAARAAGALREVADSDVQTFLNPRLPGGPVVLHCGTAWSQRSRSVAARLAEWAGSSPHAAAVTCATAELGAVPELVSQRAVKGIPAVFLIRGGKVEHRVDAADVAALDRILELAGSFAAVAKEASAPVAAGCSAAEALALADELWRRGTAPAEIEQLYEHALSADAAHGFRARLGMLRCAISSCEAETAGGHSSPSPDAVERAARALAEVETHHEEDLLGLEVREDSAEVAQALARAGLLIDAWRLGPSLLAGSPGTEAEGEMEADVLHHFSSGHEKMALDAALLWYKNAAVDDVYGLASSYASRDRIVPDRGFVYSKSIYAHPEFSSSFEESAGPAEPRAMLNRLLLAVGPYSDIGIRARAELEVLIDRKPWQRWHTRFVTKHKGGAPRRGWGTGAGSGFSSRYWVAFGPDRMRPNSRKMGSPFSDKND